MEATIVTPLKLETDLNVDVANVDIERALREKLGIDDYGLRNAAIRAGEMEPDKELEQLFSTHLTDTIRECSWLAHILSRDSWLALLICGGNHVKSIATRAQSISIQAVIANEDYQP